MSNATPPKATVTVDVTDCSLSAEQLRSYATEFYGFPHEEIRTGILVFRFDGPDAEANSQHFQRFLERFPPLEPTV